MEQTFTIDFDTMRSNCIQIHSEVFYMLKVANHIGEDLGLIVKEADELIKHPETKSWDGMGRYAKKLYDDVEMWEKLPIKLWVEYEDRKIEWIKEKAKAELLDCYYQLGGKNLYK